MDRVNAGSGFLPGLFGRKSRLRGTTSNDTKLEPGPSRAILRAIPSKIRIEFLAMAGEFVGTFMFLFFAFSGTQVANTPSTTSGSNSTSITASGPDPAALLYIALSFGFSLAVNAWIFFRVTGGLFNPAVTLGLCLIGAVPFSRGVLVFLAQMLGAMSSAAVVSALFPGPLAVKTTLGGGTSIVQGLFIEMFLTAQLVFTIFMLAAEKHKSTFLAPIGIGLSLFIAELGGVYYTGGSLNPARSFGPAVATRSFTGYHWIYWVGPLLGALVASGFFWFIKGAEYESVNPGQDFDDLEANAFDPEKDLTRPVISPTAAGDPNSRSNPGTDSRMDALLEGQQPPIRNPMGAHRTGAIAQNPKVQTQSNAQAQPGSLRREQRPSSSRHSGGGVTQSEHPRTTHCSTEGPSLDSRSGGRSRSGSRQYRISNDGTMVQYHHDDNRY